MGEASPDELLATHGVPETSFCRVHIPQSLANSVRGVLPGDGRWRRSVAKLLLRSRQWAVC